MTQNPPRTFLIVTTILFGGGALVGTFPALFSFFLFDAPGSETNPATILLFCSALSFPVVCLASIALSWILYTRKRWRAACWAAFLPGLNLLAGAAALLFLEFFNGGRLN